MSSHTTPACFHCGLPIITHDPNWVVTIDEQRRNMCCQGCTAVAQSILELGLTEYYTTRRLYAHPIDSTTSSKTAWVPEALAQYNVRSTQEASDMPITQEALLSLQHVQCAACIWLIEQRLLRVKGVIKVEINAATHLLQVGWNGAICQLHDILLALHKIGYPAYPYTPTAHHTQLIKEKKILFRQTFIAGLAMMQVMMYALPLYLAKADTLDADIQKLMYWAGFFLTLPAIFYSARPFFKGAWQALRAKLLSMDVPVSLGILAAFIASTVSTLRGQGSVYFDSITMFIFLLLASRYLLLAAQVKAVTSLNQLQQHLPSVAHHVASFPSDLTITPVLPNTLKIEDVILIKPGEVTPVDCVVLEGTSSLDLSLLTGESLPQVKTVGDVLPSGAINITQPLFAQVKKDVHQSTLSVLLSYIQRASCTKPQLALWADKIAAWFVLGLLLLCLVIFIVWQYIDPQRAWPIAIAVLVVSCPCALSLATPTALALANDYLLKRGVLIVQSHVLETFKAATHLIFDKTGTLTKGQPTLAHITCLSQDATLASYYTESTCLSIAAHLEHLSAHPFALALCHAAKARNLTISSACHTVEHSMGQGVSGTMDGVAYRLGHIDFVAKIISPDKAHARLPSWGPAYATPIFLANHDGWLARFDMVDALREEAHDVVRTFQTQQKKLILLSGDKQHIAEAVANQLGISCALGDYLPEQKLAYVQELQAQGAVVAMVGDGMNDAAVLRGANVSFAMGCGTALAQTHADCVLLGGGLSALSTTYRIALKTMMIIKQNLTWAIAYNIIAIPATAAGWVSPWLSAIGMSVSSLIVVCNALRLMR